MNNNEIFVGMCYIYEKLGLNRKKTYRNKMCLLSNFTYDAQARRRIGLKIERDWNFWKEISTLF